MSGKVQKIERDTLPEYPNHRFDGEIIERPQWTRRNFNLAMLCIAMLNAVTN